MHELPWITIFGSWVRRFANIFHEWQSHSWKSLGNSFTSDPKIVIQVNECIILFLTCYFMFWTHNSAKKQFSIPDFPIVAKDGLFWLSIVTSPELICDITRMWGTGIVTSYSSIVLARANWCKCDLYQWITTVNINFSPPGIHGLTCKKKKSSMWLLKLTLWMLFLHHSTFWCSNT